MLRIESVEIHGFKSFCDRTEVRLQDGITAVVGPNGCGKSNIGDAIHWVLGEQSARTLRGGKMEDVIFAGTEARGPHGMAEVSLHFASSTANLPGGDPSAIVTRRLFRSGDSEYLINGRKVRLRDIHEMLHAAHVGATTYAVIEQGKIDAILSAKPRDRRTLIEEAAGIIGYKQKRHLAELKLEATQANLLRIHDVILEVRRQINSLKRQAARARRYSRVRDELRQLEARILAARARALEAESARARTQLAEAQAREAEAAALLARLEAGVEASRESRREIESRIAGSREESHRLSREIDREESSVRSEADRAEELRAEAARLTAEGQEIALRLEEGQASRASREQALASIDSELEAIGRTVELLAGEERELLDRSGEIAAGIEARRAAQVAGAAKLAEISNTILHLDRELKRLEAQAVRLAAEREAVAQEAASLGARLDEARSAGEAAAGTCEGARRLAEEVRERSAALEEKTRALGETVAARREALARADERVRSLEDVENRLAGIGSGARWLLTRNDGGGRAAVRGVVADFLRVSPESEAAVEGFLGPLLGAVVVPSSENVVALVEELRESRAGRCLFVTEDPAATAPGPASLPQSLVAEPAVKGPMSKLVETSNGIGGLLAPRLSEAVLVSDLAKAIELARRYPGRDYVTPDGDLVARDGSIEGGREQGAEDGLLARRRLLDATRAERGRFEAQLSDEEGVRREAEEARQGAARELTVAERSLQEAERQAALEREREIALAAEHERTARRAALLEEEIATLETERRSTADRLAEAGRERAELEAELARQVEEIAEQRAELERLREEAAQRTARLDEQRQARAAVRERRSHIAADAERLRAEVASLAESLDRGRARSEEAASRGEAAEKASLEARERLAGLIAAHAVASGALAEGEERLREADSSAQDLEQGAREHRSQLDVERESRRAAEMATGSAEAELRHLDERCRTTLDEELAAVLGRVPEETDVDLATLESETANLRSKLEAIGPVNLLAIEEVGSPGTELEFAL